MSSRQLLLFFWGISFAYNCTRKDTVVTLTYPAAKPQKVHTVLVNFLTYSEGKTDGNIHPAKIQVGPNSEDTLNVGIAQDLAGGLGGQWQAAVWIAAFQAAAALGRDLTDYEVLVRGQGFIDGPSAGALFAAGMMAAMAKVPVRSDVTMTGIVNPDGTVGPVGGIPNKFRAAVKAGKKILGYPMGQRYTLDMATQKVIDLQEFAKENGVQVVEIHSVDEAFALLTGYQIPRIKPLPTEQLALLPATLERLKQKNGIWKERYHHFLSLFYNEKLQELLDSATKMETARTLAGVAESFFNSNAFPIAYELFQISAARAFSAYAYGRFVQYVLNGKFVELFKEVSNMFTPVGAGLEQMLNAAQKFTPKNIEKTNAFLCMLEQTIAALGYTQDAAHAVDSVRSILENVNQLKAKNVPAEKIVSALVTDLLRASSRYGKALMRIEKAKELMELVEQDPTPISISEKRLKAVANMYLAVAQANMNYIDQIFIPDLARSAESNEDAVRANLIRQNDAYMLAFTGVRYPQTLFKKKWGENVVGTFWAQIAGSMSSYFASSMFLMHHYSLGAENDGTTVRMEKALNSMLEHAEQNVRLQAALLQQSHHMIPVTARFFYTIGMVMKTQETQMKLRALEMFWRASMLCQFSLQLTRPM